MFRLIVVLEICIMLIIYFINVIIYFKNIKNKSECKDTDPFIRDLTNILFYVLLIGLIFYVLYNIIYSIKGLQKFLPKNSKGKIVNLYPKFVEVV